MFKIVEEDFVLTELVNLKESHTFKKWDRTYEDVELYDKPLNWGSGRKPISIPSLHSYRGNTFSNAGRRGNHIQPRIASEIVGNLKFWLIREARRIFQQHYVFGSNKPLLPTNIPVERVLDFSPSMRNKKPVIANFMRTIYASVSDHDIDAVYDDCISEYKYLLLKKMTEAEREGFYTNCYQSIAFKLGEYGQKYKELAFKKFGHYSNGGVSYGQTYFHPSSFGNGSGAYSGMSITEHYVHTSNKFSVGFVEHLFGKYSQQIQALLENPAPNQVVVHLGQYAHDRKEILKEFIANEHNLMARTSHIFEEVFDINDAWTFFNDYEARKIMAGGSDYTRLSTMRLFGASNNGKKTLYQRLRANCKLDPTRLHVAYRAGASRINLKCDHDLTIPSEAKFKGLVNGTLGDLFLIPSEDPFKGWDSYNHFETTLNDDKHNPYFKHKDRFATSEVVFYQGYADHIQTAYRFRPLIEMLVFNFKKNGYFYPTNLEEKFPWKEQGLTETTWAQPTRASLGLKMSVQALEIAKKMPITAFTSWIANSSEKAKQSEGASSVYVYYHGILFEFPVNDILPEYDVQESKVWHFANEL